MVMGQSAAIAIDTNSTFQDFDNESFKTELVNYKQRLE